MNQVSLVPSLEEFHIDSDSSSTPPMTKKRSRGGELPKQIIEIVYKREACKRKFNTKEDCEELRLLVADYDDALKLFAEY